MAVPSVPEVNTTKTYADLTTARLERDSVIKHSGTYSIKTNSIDEDGYSVYGEGVLPNSLSTPFVRIRFLLEALPEDDELVEVGVITNNDPETLIGKYYSVQLVNSLGTVEINFVSGNIDLSGGVISLIEVDTENEVDASLWMMDWCYLDVYRGNIYLYDSDGVLKYHKILLEGSVDLGTVGVFLKDTTEDGVSKPHIDVFYVNDVSPYD